MPYHRTLTVWVKEHTGAVALVVSIAIILRLVVFAFVLHAYGNNIANWVGGAPATHEELAAHDANIAGDCYYETSANLLAGRGFSCELLPPYEPYQYGVPLYPFFIAAFLFLTHSYYVTLFVQILLSALTCVLGMYVADIVLPWAKAAPFVGVFLALEPNQLLTPLNFASEVLFMPLFFVFIIFFVRYLREPRLRDLLWAGCALGLAALVKPTVQYLPLLLIAFVLWQQRHALNRRLGLHLIYFVGIFVLMLSPWLYSNYSQFGVVSLSTQAVRNPYIALLPSVISVATGASFDDAQATLLRAHPNNFTFANSAGMMRYTITQLTHYPLADIEVALLSAVTFFTADDVATLYNAVGIQPSGHLSRPALMLFVTSPLLAAKTVFTYIDSNVALILLARIFFVLVSAAFLYGLYAIYRTKRADTVFNFAVLLIAYFLLTTMSNGFGVTARFRMPVEALMFAIAYGGIVLFFYAKKSVS